MKKFMIIALTTVLSVMSANAQEACCANGGGCCWSPYWYIQAQGGVQLPYTPGERKDLLSPVFGLNIGRQVTPLIGVRLGVEGYNSKVQDQLDVETYNKFKYYDASFDATLNIVNLFSKKPCHPVNFYLLAGAGYSWSEATPNSSTWFAPSCRVGAILEAKLGKNVSLSLEHRMTNTSTQWNGRIDGSKQHDWYSSTMLGLAINFGHKKAKKAEPVVVEPVYATRVDTVWYDDTEYKTVEVAEELKRDIHYQIRKADPVSERMVNEIAQFVKNHKDAKVTVTGYADKGTGNAKVNMKYSEQRAVAVADALKAAGVSADIITVDWKGDTVQPFAENDENRVAITVATGIGEKKEPVKVKKFRTKEVRYQVQ